MMNRLFSDFFFSLPNSHPLDPPYCAHIACSNCIITCIHVTSVYECEWTWKSCLFCIRKNLSEAGSVICLEFGLVNVLSYVRILTRIRNYSGNPIIETPCRKNIHRGILWLFHGEKCVTTVFKMIHSSLSPQNKTKMKIRTSNEIKRRAAAARRQVFKKKRSINILDQCKIYNWFD